MKKSYHLYIPLDFYFEVSVDHVNKEMQSCIVQDLRSITCKICVNSLVFLLNLNFKHWVNVDFKMDYRMKPFKSLVTLYLKFHVVGSMLMVVVLPLGGTADNDAACHVACLFTCACMTLCISSV